MANLLYRPGDFAGIKTLAFAIMKNHFRVLAHLRDMPTDTLTGEEIIRRVGVRDGEASAVCLGKEAKRLASLPAGSELVRRELDRYFRRIYGINEFMKTFKQR